MMRRCGGTLILMLQLGTAMPVAVAYDVATHSDISSRAATVSSLGVDDVLTRIGLRQLATDDSNQAFEGSPPGHPKSIDKLVRFGAAWEDNLSALQAVRHFYDPVNDLPLNLTESIGTSLSIRSPDWALEDLTTYTSPFASQNFSYKDARNYFFSALTMPSELERRQFFGLTFQTLGHVIHHLQDMAQPQHVRNDAHCDAFECQLAATVLGSKQLYSPSLYERYTNGDSVRPRLPFNGSGSNPAYPGADPASNPFTTPRRFWRTTPAGSAITSGMGIAEYTNRNFFSAGSIYRYGSPALPEISRPSEVVDISNLIPGTYLRGVVYFYGSTVFDALTGASTPNSRAAAGSVFAPDLADKILSTETQGLFLALNRFTFDAAHQFLIPRAVAFSAGLINYFFRGRLRISLPDEGVYGIVDHNDPRYSDPLTGGFPKIKLKLQNVTPRGVDSAGSATVEPMAEGADATLVAVAKFRRNNCYQADLSGEYGSPGNDWQTCRSAKEEIVVSSPTPVPAGINGDPQPVTFVFPNRIPISATDLYLQVVYRGPLGEEQDAVVVETKDISEPTYTYNYQNWDAFTYACPSWPALSIGSGCTGQYTYAQWCTGSPGAFPTADACALAMGITTKHEFSATAQPVPNYDPANYPAVPPGTWVDMSQEMPFAALAIMPGPVGTFSRIAILTDAAPSNVRLVVQEHVDATHGNSNFLWASRPVTATINQADPATNTLAPSVAYLQARGIYVFAADYDWTMGYGQIPNPPPLRPVLSQINF